MQFPRLPLLSALALTLAVSSPAAPYRNLTLLQEIDAGTAPSPADRYESRGTVGTQTVLGQTVRVATGTNSWFGYKLGSNLEYDRPYVIEVVYPEDTPRAYLMALMDCGGHQPGSHYAFHTGAYEAETYGTGADYNPLNLTSYPLRQQYKSYWMIAWPQREWWADSSMNFHTFHTNPLSNPDGTTRPGTQHGTWDTGVWLYFLNKADDPNNHGPAVKTIRIYSVRSIDDLVDPVVDQLRRTSPRPTFWTLESPGRNTGPTQVARARVAGVNTIVPVCMEWNFNFRASYSQWNYYRTAFRTALRDVLPAARQHGMGIIPKVEYGGSNNLPDSAKALAIESKLYEWRDPATNSGLQYAFHGRAEERRIKVRAPEARAELKHLIDVIFDEAGSDADLIKGVMIRNRCGYFAPSFSDDDITAYEAETGNVIPSMEANPPVPNESAFDKKRRKLYDEIPWNNKWAKWKEHAPKMEGRRNHPYMQWTYAKIADFVEDIKNHLQSNYGSDKILLYHQFTGEGIFVKMPSPPQTEAEIMAGEEWGFVPGINANKTFMPLMPVDQHWNAGSALNLNALASQAGISVLADPMYIEYGWKKSANDLSGFPYTRMSPVYEHGGQEYSVRTEILATANCNPKLLGKSAFTTIHRGSPDAWNAFLRNFYLIPNEAGTIVSETADVTVKSYSAGRVLAINKSLVPQTVNLGAAYPTLYDKITGNAVNSTALTLGACSMQMYGTQSGGVTATPAPLPPPKPYQNVIQAETGTPGNVNSGTSVGEFKDDLKPYSNGSIYGFAYGSGSCISIPVIVATADNYDIAVRYSSAVAGRPIRFDVNGQTVVSNIELPLTGNYREFLVHTFQAVPLNAGTNIVRFVAATYGGPGIDEIEVIKPNDGTTVYFQDSFSYLTTGNWSAGQNSPWSLVQDNNDYVYDCGFHWYHTGRNLAGESWWTNYQLDLDFKISCMEPWSYTYAYGRYVDENNHYYVSIEKTDTGTRVRLTRVLNGASTVLGSTYVSIPLNAWQHLTWAMSGSLLSVQLNGVSLINVSDATPIAAGKIGLAAQKQAVRFDNVLVTGPQMQLAYQAEEYTAQSACTFGNTNVGYTGTGYMRYNANGSYFEWNTVNPGPGSRKLVFRYATGSTYDRPCQIYVNGTLVGSMTFSPTGSWTTWGTTSLAGVTLNPGNNTVRVKANTWAGGPDLDKMEVQ